MFSTCRLILDECRGRWQGFLVENTTRFRSVNNSYYVSTPVNKRRKWNPGYSRILSSSVRLHRNHITHKRHAGWLRRRVIHSGETTVREATVLNTRRAHTSRRTFAFQGGTAFAPIRWKKECLTTAFDATNPFFF